MLFCTTFNAIYFLVILLLLNSSQFKFNVTNFLLSFSCSHFEKVIRHALRSKALVFEDVYVVPNYVAALKSCVDPDFKRFAKQEWAQLQWIFEKVDLCEKYHLGVKTTYRAYAQDIMNEIVESDEKDTSFTGYIGQECETIVYPLPHQSAICPLLHLPTPGIQFSPAEFKPSSHDFVSKCATAQISFALWE